MIFASKKKKLLQYYFCPQSVRKSSEISRAIQQLLIEETVKNLINVSYPFVQMSGPHWDGIHKPYLLTVISVLPRQLNNTHISNMFIFGQLSAVLMARDPHPNTHLWPSQTCPSIDILLMVPLPILISISSRVVDIRNPFLGLAYCLTAVIYCIIYCFLMSV